ncbi:MAG TPA: TIGR02530 family flagellar biosynthesis protein [bacterium]|jgi:flagellar operon protein
MSILPINPGTPILAPQETTNARRSGSAAVSQNPNAFQRELSRLTKPEKLNFSRHASKRLDMRGISFTPDGINRISTAIDKAASKGSRDTLVLAGELSLVVNVPSRTVVTVMGREDMNESIVTNIDSTVFA